MFSQTSPTRARRTTAEAKLRKSGRLGSGLACALFLFLGCQFADAGPSDTAPLVAEASPERGVVDALFVASAVDEIQRAVAAEDSAEARMAARNSGLAEALRLLDSNVDRRSEERAVTAAELRAQIYTTDECGRDIAEVLRTRADHGVFYRPTEQDLAIGQEHAARLAALHAEMAREHVDDLPPVESPATTQAPLDPFQQATLTDHESSPTLAESTDEGAGHAAL